MSKRKMQWRYCMHGKLGGGATVLVMVNAAVLSRGRDLIS